MARHSSATSISYDLRPAKQSERRIILDLLKVGGDCGFDLPSYRYIGMGANRFYDFLLVHKYIGINNMISLERNASMYERALFNCPYGFIKVEHSSASTYIAADSFEESSVVWLDYDGGISQNVINDISSLASKLNIGDFCFVTVSGSQPGITETKNDRERLSWLQEELGQVSGEVILEDVSRANFPIAVHKILIAAFKNAFSILRDCEFVPFLQVQYADGSKMITVGGAVIANSEVKKFKKKIKQSIPFLPLEDSKLYEIRSFNLTERERILFDKATTKNRKKSAESNQLRKIGFVDNDFKAYQDLIRYLPRYVETMV